MINIETEGFQRQMVEYLIRTPLDHKNIRH